MQSQMSGSRIRIYLSLIIAIIFIITTTGSSICWSNGGYSSDENNPDFGTHDWIANAALQPQTKDISFLKTTYHSRFLLGTEAPDNPSYIGDTGKHHVYYYADGGIQDDACAARASSIYASALQYLKSNDFEHAAFEIGVMAHYISDVGVFGHTMGSTTAWGSETHHSDYEDKINVKVQSIPIPTNIVLESSDAYNATINLAKDTTFGNATLHIESNVWMDDHYDWSNESFSSSTLSSMNESVRMVSSAINHLMIDSGEASGLPAPQGNDSMILIILGVSIASGSVITVAVYRNRRRR